MGTMADVIAEARVKQAERDARLRATQFYTEVVDGLTPLVTMSLEVYRSALVLDPDAMQADAELAPAPQSGRRGGRDHSGTLRLQTLRLQMQAAKAVIGTARQFMGKSAASKDDDAETEPQDAGDVQDICNQFGLEGDEPRGPRTVAKRDGRTG